MKACTTSVTALTAGARLSPPTSVHAVVCAAMHANGHCLAASVGPFSACISHHALHSPPCLSITALHTIAFYTTARISSTQYHSPPYCGHCFGIDIAWPVSAPSILPSDKKADCDACRSAATRRAYALYSDRPAKNNNTVTGVWA